jgi:putative sterol carrier protein
MTAREILEALPGKVAPEAIEGLETNFHFDLEGDGGGELTVSVAEGKVTVEEGLSGDPKCTVRAKAENFVKLAKGDLNPMMAILMGKVKISNQGEMIKYAKIFGLM